VLLKRTYRETDVNVRIGGYKEMYEVKSRRKAKG